MKATEDRFENKNLYLCSPSLYVVGAEVMVAAPAATPVTVVAMVFEPLSIKGV